jgi:hypothetical protein
MSLLYLSDHTFAVYRSEHTFRLDELDDEDEEVDETDDDSTYLEAIGGFVDEDQDDWSSSATGVDMLMGKSSNTPGNARAAKSLAQSPPIQDRFCLSSHKQSCGSKVLASTTVSLDKSRTIAALLHESLGEILSSSQRDVGISALGKVAKNIHSLARVESKDVQKERLADLLAEGPCGLEHRGATRRSGPRSAHNQAMTTEQQNQLVDAIADAFSKIEVLIAAEDDESIQGSIPNASKIAPRTAVHSTLSCASDNRRPSCYSDVSSITSCTSTTLHYESPALPVLRLNGSNLPSNAANVPAPPLSTPPKPTPSKLLGDHVGVALQDSFSTALSFDSDDDASPKRPQRLSSSRDLALHDSFTSFCSLDSDDDKAPARPQRCDSVRGMTGDATATVHSIPSDDPVPGLQGSPRRPGGRRRADIRAAPPQRQGSFDDKN